MIQRSEYGLIYQEDFDNTTPWSLLSGTGSIEILAGKLRIVNPSSSYWYLNSISNLKNLFIQSNAKVTQAWGYIGPICRAVQVAQNIVYAYGHWGRTGSGGDYDRLYQYLSGTPTALVNYSHGSSQRSNGSYYDIFLWINDGNYRLFCDCSQGGHTFNGSNCTQLATDKTGIFTHAPTGYSYISLYNVMKHKDIICMGLPTGWKLRINEDDNYKATESSGTATVDCFDLVFGTIDKVEVLNASDIVQETFEATDDIWAGDEYTYSSLKRVISNKFHSVEKSGGFLIQ